MRNTEEQGRQNQVLPEAEASTSIQRRAESQVPANQETSSLSPLKLPNEVLCGITGYLDLPERMLLALTCKFLMSLASPERSLPRLDPPRQKEIPSRSAEGHSENLSLPLVFEIAEIKPRA
ncbi:uncharacterized protein TrAtP1_007415 [Trichoderma atroviride]|uniref:uncharacterized protein n=1 Tax=Hypocrea atroviridis TaxID=63577 RepID=UPI003321EEFE|nr:hypothetical protein TrAtP1_007415 [Trichoderma atroviride]